MDCKSPGLKLLRQKTRNALQAWPHCELFHVRRDWNASADMLAGQALQRQGGRNVHSPEEIQDLKTLNRLEEVIRPRTSSPDMAAPASLDADNLDAKNLDAENLDAGTRDTDDPAGNATDAGRGTAQVLAVTTRSAAARTTTDLQKFWRSWWCNDCAWTASASPRTKRSGSSTSRSISAATSETCLDAR
ncbi:hypothetical protein PR002_g30773 [Phytophthora rubi]|uniref:Uncharacterized protein n=1 Tax=Phytophthora rubi TaxID=129364 RepID=A0A6A3GPX6_9STRA|nr:hypothetical protein PR002_g30773 [Phytophthora rubi]